MQKAPFLVTYGGFVWKLLVVSAAVIAIAISARKAYRHRARRGNAHRWVWSQVALVLFRAAVAAIAVTLLLILIGRVAMGIAGDRPFEGRNDDQVSQLDPVAIAAATPVYRPRALEKFAAAGFEFELDCETRLAHAQLDELITHSNECRMPSYWKAYAFLMGGQPCEAVDALSTIDSSSSTDLAGLKLLALAGIGCRRWSITATAAQRIGKLAGDSAWQCVGDAASVRSGARNPNRLAETDSCFPLLVATAPRHEAAIRVQEWASKPRSESPPRLFSITAIQHAPAIFRDIRTLEFLVPMDIESLVDVLSNQERDSALLVPVFANLVLKAGVDDIGPAARIQWLAAAIIGDVIADNFGHARELVAEVERTAQSMTPDQASARPGALEWAREQAARQEVMIKYRLGEPLPRDARALSDIDSACFALRRGEVPVSEGVSKDALSIAQALMAGDSAPLSRAVRSRAIPFSLAQLLGALAPRTRPVPPDLVRFVETPRWSIVREPLPAAIAWDAAGRRDVLRMLGETKRAERWAEIARRQWQLASDPELAVFYAFIAE